MSNEQDKSVNTEEPTSNFIMGKSPIEYNYVFKPNDKRVPIPIMGLTKKEFDEVAGNIATSSLRGTDTTWREAVNTSTVEQITYGGTKQTIDLEEAFTKGKWAQQVEHAGNTLRMGKPKPDNHSKNEVISGSAAVSRIQVLTGVGNFIRIPLWASGIWITIKAPTMSELLNLNIKLNQTKEEAGRETYGAIFSNRQALLIQDVTAFIIDHIHECSILNWTDLNLFEYIKAIDLFPLINAQAASIYIDGYPHELPCIQDPKNCNNVTKVNLNLGKMLWTDGSKITTEAREFMLRTQRNQTSKEEVIAYQENIVAAQKEYFDVEAVNGTIRICLTLSSAEDYISASSRWIEEIHEIINEAVLQNSEGKSRQALVRSHMYMARLREYSHYIDRIILDPGTDTEQSIIDRNSIESTLTALSDNLEMIDQIITKIGLYVSQSPFTIVAIPNFKCKCGRDYRNEEDLNKESNMLVPVNPLLLFMKIAELRISSKGR